MSEEEKETVEYFEKFVPFMWWKNPDENGRLKVDTELSNKIDVLLNLIQKQQEELKYIKDLDIPIETLVAEFERLEDLEDDRDILKVEIKKKDKIIDEMVKVMSRNMSCDFIRTIDEKCANTDCEKCFKQYFEKKVEGK